VTYLLDVPSVAGIVINAHDVTEHKQAQEARLLSEERWRLLLQNSSDAVSVISGEGTILFSTPAVSWLFGYSPEQWVGKSMAELIHPDEIDQLADEFARILATPGLHDPIRIRVRHADGSWRWVEAVTNNLLDDPRVGGIVVNSRDVTARKQAEDALHASEERWRILVQNSSDLVSVISPEGKIVFSTPSAMRLEPGTEPGNDMFDFVHPADRERAAGLFQEVLATRGLSPPIELRIRNPDGSWHWVESRANNLVNDPLIGGVVVNTRDITERKRAEEALSRSEQRSRLIIEQSSDVISVVNPDGTTRYSSPALHRMLGYPDGYRPGFDEVSSLIHPDDRETALRAFYATVDSPDVDGPIRFRFRHGDGTWRYLESIVTDLRDEPAIAGLVITTRDITEREETKRQRLVDEVVADLIAGATDDPVGAMALEAGLARARRYQVAVIGVVDADTALSDDLRRSIACELGEPTATAGLRGSFAGLGVFVLPVPEDEDASSPRDGCGLRQ
jgi:PAS domain S-box-containing protein